MPGAQAKGNVTAEINLSESILAGQHSRVFRTFFHYLKSFSNEVRNVL